MDLNYPPVGFHFAVVFELFPQTPNDFRFQEVQGLSVEVETEEFKEGGENRFVHKLPTRTKYQELVLKRGMFVGSGIILWCRNAIENFDFQPTNLTVTLLNEDHIPIAAWYIVNAYPTSWSITDLNAMESKVVVESIKLRYNYFKILRF
jgi:phage tail-like protein